MYSMYLHGNTLCTDWLESEIFNAS